MRVGLLMLCALMRTQALCTPRTVQSPPCTRTPHSHHLSPTTLTPTRTLTPTLTATLTHCHPRCHPHCHPHCHPQTPPLPLPPPPPPQVVLSPTEKAAYLRLHHQASQQYKQLRQMGTQQVSKKMLQVMRLLLPLRKICSGSTLTAKDMQLPDVVGEAQMGGEQGGAPVLPDDVGECR